MDKADLLLDEIHKYVRAQKQCAEKFKTLANELENLVNAAKISKISGSAASVGGSVLMTAAGIGTFCTGGAALPLLAAAGTAGGIISGLGSATIVCAEIIVAECSSPKTEEAEKAAKKIQSLEQIIQKLMESLKEEGKKKGDVVSAAALDAACSDVLQENFVVRQILRAIARQNGLLINRNINLQMVIQYLSKKKTSRKGGLWNSVGLYTFIGTLVTKIAVRTVAKRIPQLVTSAGRKAATKAIGHIGGGAFGLVLSIPELIENIQEGSKVSDATQNLRENARMLLDASKELEEDLEQIKRVFQRLAKIRDYIEKQKRSSDEKKTLIDFAIENCQNETARQWLKENSEFQDFFQLVDMFHFIKEHIHKKDKDNCINDIHITFIAHGKISDLLIPASCLLPLPTISDVLLYSPWNCRLTADAAYAVATGRMKPQHRVFVSKDSGKDHQPESLPDEWNSMKKATRKGRKVPNIYLSPFSQAGDPAWERFESLKKKYGPPDGNRIIIPFILPQNSGIKGTVPFSIITLAMSLVLMFSRFQATLHLTTCLGDLVAGEELDKCPGAKKARQEYLTKQYAYTNNKPTMTIDSGLLKNLAAFLST